MMEPAAELVQRRLRLPDRLLAHPIRRVAVGDVEGRLSNARSPERERDCRVPSSTVPEHHLYLNSVVTRKRHDLREASAKLNEQLAGSATRESEHCGEVMAILGIRLDLRTGPDPGQRLTPRRF